MRTRITIVFETHGLGTAEKNNGSSGSSKTLAILQQIIVPFDNSFSKLALKKQAKREEAENPKRATA